MRQGQQLAVTVNDVIVSRGEGGGGYLGQLSLGISAAGFSEPLHY